MFIGIGPNLSGWGMPFHQLDRSRVMELSFLLENGDPISKSLVRGAAPAIVRASADTGFDRSGVLQTDTANNPVFTFDPVTGQSLGLQVPSAAPQSITAPEDLGDAAWALLGTNPPTLDTNAAIAPDGNMAADEVTFGSGNDSRVDQLATANTSASTEYTFSVYARVAAGTDTFLVYFFDNGTGGKA